ncbi:hypothetical protein SAMN04490355_101059 [Pelosinus propionicus DSM 13327]|uniref:Uncharacterized protein n=1 Tax=Pelosinus propionicus DSM 13327 TaxID=1123291 RepID=A0A1I4J130_9FIRM|nr:hypothetical protein SAMN04490355_101059 [Pelosinus propionicus DSM 13327]
MRRGIFLAEDKKKQEFLVTKDSLIVGGKKYPKEQPPPEVVQDLAKAIQAMLKKDLH